MNDVVVLRIGGFDWWCGKAICNNFFRWVLGLIIDDSNLSKNYFSSVYCKLS